MCMVTLLPGGYTDNKWFTQKTSRLHAIYHQMICQNQFHTCKTTVKVYGPSGSPITFWIFLSLNENSHVQVINIAQHCRGVV